jgi:hypothetical protein
VQTITVQIADIQLELGGTASTFGLRPLADEMLLCQRYYRRIRAAVYYLAHSASQYFAQTVTLYPPMRSAPSTAVAGTPVENINLSLWQADNITASGFRLIGMATAASGASWIGDLDLSAEF